MVKAEKHPYRMTTILVLFLLLLPCFLRTVQIPDEGRYAEVSREMLINQTWLVPHINGVPHLTKPPLYYNLAAFFLFLFGIHIFSIRLVSVAAFLFGLFFCIRWGLKRQGVKASLLAGLIGATMFQPASAAQFADLNMLLTFWLTGGLLLFFDALENPGKKRPWYGAWIFFALAFLTKGPPALMIPLGTIFLYRLVSGRKFSIPLSRWIPGVFLYCLIAFPWYFWIFEREGDKLSRFWFDNIFRRTTLGEVKGRNYIGFYIPVFLFGGAGWSFLAVSELIAKIKAGRKVEKIPPQSPGKSHRGYLKGILNKIRKMPHDQIWLLCWIAATIIPFSIILSNMMSYIQPCYPAFALLLALYFTRKGEGLEQPKIRRTLWFSIALITLIGWSWSVYGYIKVHSSSLRIPVKVTKYLEPLWIDHKLHSLKNKSYLFIQYDYFSPVFNFENQRNSVLVRESVNSIWPYPPFLRFSMQELLHVVRQNRPLALIVEPHNYGFVSGEGWENLHVYFRGKHLMLLVTDTLELPPP
jgi:4-amino-4-deoxy-L-arabinose transferase-like glycosyltransferase